MKTIKSEKKNKADYADYWFIPGVLVGVLLLGSIAGGIGYTIGSRPIIVKRTDFERTMDVLCRAKGYDKYTTEAVSGVNPVCSKTRVEYTTIYALYGKETADVLLYWDDSVSQTLFDGKR